MNELARIEIVLFLQSVDLFTFCRAEDIVRISAIVDQKSVAGGDTVFERDQPANTLYCVVQGEVTVEEGDGSRAVGPLRCFGVEEILTGRRRTGSARAARDTLLLAIPADDFFDLLANDVEIVKGLFRRLLPERPAPTSASS